MSITDELRERIDAVCRVSGWDCKRLTAIADRIDAEHERLMQEQPFTVDMVPMTDERMAEHGWVRLPKDADGEPIHIGDELRDEWHEQNQGEVEWLMLDHHGWWLMFKNNCERFYLHDFHEWHHHKQPTVEDTLHELIGKALMLSEIDGENELVAEYAKRLTLRGDGE